jgi:DNA-directed RNA polymerase subunit RPC12/RpoP
LTSSDENTILDGRRKMNEETKYDCPHCKTNPNCKGKPTRVVEVEQGIVCAYCGHVFVPAEKKG